jgi:hypothetical protein
MADTEGSLTVTRLIDEVTSAIHGYVRDQEMVTTLTTPLTDSSTAATVSEANQLSRGLIEIGDELLYVQDIATSGTGDFTIAPWGRGQDGTTAVAHDAGSKVTMSPLYPRRKVRDTIFWILREMFPRVYGVATEFYDVDVVRTNYPLPDDCWQVFTVEWHLPGPSFMWQPMDRWRVNHTATTQELEMLGLRWPGQNRARILYSKTPPDDYTVDDLADYGYTQNIHDIVVLGATARLLQLTEPARLQVESVESHGRSDVVQGGTITQVAQKMYAMFDRRVEQEAFRLQQRYTLQPHRTR